MLRSFLSAVVIALLVGAGPAVAEGVALTFDDLPTMALTGDAPYAEATTKALLAGLRRHHLPATGFVIADKLEGDGGVAQTRLARQWLAAGMDLGNHTYSHVSLNKVPVQAYIAEVSRADGVLRPLVAAQGRPLRWFRHPYLETGLTFEARRTFETWLAAHGYRVAPVTMENSDWMFALPYDDAILRHDKAGAAHVQRAYLDYTERVVVWYREAGLQLLGRRPDFVFLLHATRLNADSLDQLAAILRRQDLHAMSLDRAMRDPAYKIADDYAGPDGDEWLSRWSRTLRKDLPWKSFPEPPADIAAENDRLDPSP
ncbi:polysaccharide deacetylase family protein [Phenylobacterium sp.]|uniref:polysaccharide deacetylase family protein n=1 Tax=Phenylobacterium sp. TaxID=1871053 RepID=UPI003562F4D1